MVAEIQLTKKQELLLPFTEGITIFEGKKGSGKTSGAIAIASELKEEFGLPVVCDFPLKESFGSYTYLDIPKFVEDLGIISAATKGESKEVAERAVDILFKKNYPSLEGSIILLDEARKYVDCRENRDKVVRLMGYWVSQIRHYRCGLLMCILHMDEIDKRIARQVDRVVRCYTDKRRGVINCMVNDFNEGTRVRMNINAERYWDMFDSWILTPMRAKHLLLGKEGEREEA